MHKAVKTTANVQTIVKLVFIIVLAALSSDVYKRQDDTYAVMKKIRRIVE